MNVSNRAKYHNDKNTVATFFDGHTILTMPMKAGEEDFSGSCEGGEPQMICFNIVPQSFGGGVSSSTAGTDTTSVPNRNSLNASYAICRGAGHPTT